jgi:hypothetical protein
MRPRTPSLPAQDIQRIHYGESFASERLQILQKARAIANQNIEDSKAASKYQHDKTAEPHNFSIGQSVWYTQTDFLKKNRKLAPKWLGPAIIIQVNESVAKIKLDNHKIKTFNVKRLKHYIARDGDSEETDDESSNETDKEIDLENLNPTNRPNTRAWAKQNKEPISSILEPDTCFQLNKIAFKIYHSNFNLEQLSESERVLWKSIPLGNIFYNLTGDSCRPPDYNKYLRIRQSDSNWQQPHQHPPPQSQEPPQQSPQRPRGRPRGSTSKNQTATRIEQYMVTRLQRTRTATKNPES